MRTARLQAVAAAVLFSTGGAAIKTAAFTGMQVSSFRAGIAALVLLLWIRGRIAWSWPMLGVAAVYAATLTLFATSTKLTTAANAIFLQSTAPFYLVLLGPLLLRERLRRPDIAYVIAAGAGLAICFAARPEPMVTAPDPELGNFLGVLSSVTWAGTLLGLRWVERRRAGIGISAVVVGSFIACGIGLPFIWPLPAAPALEWATLVYLGVFQVGLAYIFLTRAMGHLPALEASLLLLLEPVLNPIWAWLVRGEDPGTLTIAGGSIIVAATAARAIYDARRPAMPATKGGALP
jgi:drug/metabolite transporter (DMT)-like permease